MYIISKDNKPIVYVSPSQISLAHGISKMIVGTVEFDDNITIEGHKERKESALDMECLMYDLLVTALEGGSNHWYWLLKKVHEITEPYRAADDEPFAERIFRALLDGKELPIHEHDQNREEFLGTLTYDRCLKALEIMAIHWPYRYESIMTDAYDAEDADIWFQLAVMGEVVYG
jgi:hypothetical protein